MNDRANQILDIAEAEMRKGGVDAVSFRSIATEAGIKSASVHYHFPTKTILCIAVVQRYAAGFVERLGSPDDPNETARDRIRKTVRRICSSLSPRVSCLPLHGTWNYGDPSPRQSFNRGPCFFQKPECLGRNSDRRLIFKHISADDRCYFARRNDRCHNKQQHRPNTGRTRLPYDLYRRLIHGTIVAQVNDLLNLRSKVPIIGRFHICTLSCVIQISHLHNLFQVRILLKIRNFIFIHRARPANSGNGQMPRIIARNIQALSRKDTAWRPRDSEHNQSPWPGRTRQEPLHRPLHGNGLGCLPW